MFGEKEKSDKMVIELKKKCTLLNSQWVDHQMTLFIKVKEKKWWLTNPGQYCFQQFSPKDQENIIYGSVRDEETLLYLNWWHNQEKLML